MKHVEIKKCTQSCCAGTDSFYDIKYDGEGIGEICPNELGLAGPIHGWQWWSSVTETHGSAPSFQQAARRVIKEMEE